MSITINDCLQLPSLSLGTVVAGHSGLDKIVNTISVVEFDNYDDDLRTANELLLTAFYTIKDDVAAQCQAILEFKKSGDVGMVLFYLDMVLKKLDKRVLDTADNLNFPIIVMPGANMSLRYSDVISDVMEAVFLDRKNNNFFINNTIQRLSQLTPANRNISNLLSFSSDYAKASFFLCDDKRNVISNSYWPYTNELDLNLILSQPSENNQYNLYCIPFSDNNGAKLVLYAVSKNNKLNTAVVNEVIEVIKLFCVIWSYNLNIGTLESLIPAILGNDFPLIKIICEKQGIDLQSKNALFFIKINTNDHDSSQSATLITDIRSLYVSNNRKAIVGAIDEFIVIVTSHSPDITWEAIIFDELFMLLTGSALVQHTTFFSKLKLGSGCKEIYKKYCDSISLASLIYPYKKFFNSIEINFAHKCYDLINSLYGEKNQYLKLLVPIIDDREEDLLRTLETYLLDADYEIKKTAKLLYVHRNTIQYRLSKIKNLMGYDINKLPMSYDIYLATALHRALHST